MADKLDIGKIVKHYTGDESIAPGERGSVPCPLTAGHRALIDRSTERINCNRCQIRGDGLDVIMRRERFDMASAYQYARQHIGYQRSNGGVSNPQTPDEPTPDLGPEPDLDSFLPGLDLFE